MNLVSRTALVAAVALCGVSFAVTGPALAQQGKQEAQAQPKFTFSTEEQEALFKFQEAIKTNDPAAISAAMAAAAAVAQGADARYALATLKLDAGRATNNEELQLQAVDELIASGRVAQDQLPSFFKAQFNAAIDNNDLAKAETALTRLSQLQPNDPDVVTSLARLRLRQNNYAEAASLLEKSISLQKAAGRTIPENVYKTALNAAYRARMSDRSFELSRELVRTYPTAENWRTALLLYREFAKPDKAAEIDAFRLMRFTKAMSDPDEFLAYAERLNSAGYPGEATSAIDEGLASKKLSPTTPGVRELRSVASAKIADDKQGLPAQERSALAAATGTAALSIGDAYFGYGDYAKAVTLYRAALQKGSVDTNVVNTRLGMALALAGRKAEAEVAFNAVSGSRAQLADYFKLWLQQRA